MNDELKLEMQKVFGQDDSYDVSFIESDLKLKGLTDDELVAELEYIMLKNTIKASTAEGDLDVADYLKRSIC